MARWRWSEDVGWVWEDPASSRVERIKLLQQAEEPPAPSTRFREHKTKAGPLWVPDGARLHDVPFGFRAGGEQ